MSLVIMARDKSVGIAVCEGRAVAYINGSKVPVCEDASKISSLADGSILALTGGLRDGYETTRMRGTATDPLRRDIHAAAESKTFSETCAVIPSILAKYRTEYPELGFGVCLLGNDGGKIRLVSWSSGKDGIECLEDADSDVTSNVIGLSKEANAEAARAVRNYFASTPRDYLHVNDTHAAFRKIIEDLASRYVELNDRLSFDAVVAPNEPREVFDLARLLACADGSAMTTASRVSTAKASVIPAGVSVPGNNTLTALSGLSWTITAASSADVFNVSGFLRASGSVAGEMISEIYIYVDANHTTNYGDGAVCAVIPGSTVSPYAASGSFFAVITGLAAGNHTVQVYATAQAAGGNSVAFTGFGFCQRVF